MSHTYQHRAIIPQGPPSQSSRQPPASANGPPPPPLMMHASLPPGQPQPRPLTAVLDMLRGEAEALETELVGMRHEREEFEGKVTEQIQQLNTIRQALVDIKDEHQRTVNSYEARIEDLTRQLELQKGGSHRSGRLGHGHDEPPTVGHGGQNLFGGVINRGGPPPVSDYGTAVVSHGSLQHPGSLQSAPPPPSHHSSHYSNGPNGMQPSSATRIEDAHPRDRREREREQEPDLPNKRMRTDPALPGRDAMPAPLIRTVCLLDSQWAVRTALLAITLCLPRPR
ncbi:hypothetical protein BT69DRAFT_460127 [Atractiella rhizophila]|nr:hypothetical protein BT69DRAFT_460127 [Atractiella rhizophila]